MRADQRFAFRIDVESESQSPVAANLKLYSDDNAVGGQSIVLKPGLNRFELPYRLAHPGAYLMSAEVSIAPPRVALNPRVEAPITVTGAPKILIVSATIPDSLVSALKLRNYQIAFVAPRSLSEHPEDYLPYQLVILDDVPAGTMSPAAQHALNRYVADYGGGLVATGRHVARGEPGRRRFGKGVAGEVRAAAAAAVARANRSLPVHRSIELDELRLALSRRARR